MPSFLFLKPNNSKKYIQLGIMDIQSIHTLEDFSLKVNLSTQIKQLPPHLPNSLKVNRSPEMGQMLKKKLEVGYHGTQDTGFYSKLYVFQYLC